MSHTLNSTNDRSWLRESHEKRSNRSVKLGKQAIDLLIKKNEPVTYSTIADISKKIDPEGKRIHPNTIRTNEQLYEYYKQNSITYKQKMNDQNNKTNYNTTTDEFDFRKIKPNRNLENIHRKYMKLSKKELIQRLINAEQYISENNSKWGTKHFELFK
ncbi:hypothetical protein [Bacillus toyonensis]|uniref:hypothetical protein n=1 Tax=Bacillus toyonensis TaxID=155322 RepID=UPI000BF122A5|nr:hypothetical protein [Bacillus toyonensis]PEN67160.1 hypothetical protein CN545_18830 [Bacillus toyonensis]PGB09944.1 hypothetical protein COL96_19310 [Bacillus toyonensis]